MKPRLFITIDTYAIGGAGKVVLQFLKNSGPELCEPLLAGFWRGPARTWQFREAVEGLGVRFEVLKQRFAFDPFVIADALRIVRENRIDILESHGYKGHIVCYVLNRLTGIPWVAYVHGWTSENLKVDLYNFIEKVTVRYADRIVPVSENLKTRLHLGIKAEKKAVVINNAAEFIDLDQDFVNLRDTYGVHGDEVLICVVGRLSPEKGHSYFVEAFKIVSGMHSNIKAIFVGEGQERGALTKQIHQTGLDDKIILAGFQEDVNPFYHACDIVALPSLTEGMPNAALEAMMFAKPVVASNVGGIPEVVIDRETGYLVASQSPGALADALGDLIRNQQKRKDLGLAGKKKVETEFNPGTRVSKVFKMYQSLLKDCKTDQYSECTTETGK